MKTFEVTFNSVNSETYPKPITVLVIAPDKINPETGAMLFTHGWAGNRFQHRDKMEYSADKFNLVCISVEFRMSGYDFNQTTGRGAYLPYDGSFMQTFDVLNGLRFILAMMPEINRKRIFNYGGSQGGGIALLCSAFAPDTFAFTYASCAITYFDDVRQEWCGREFADYEIAIRSAIEHIDKIKCPIFLEHGTADETVPYNHTQKLVEKLKSQNKQVKVKYYEGGSHSLEPAITKIEAFKAMATEPMNNLTCDTDDDFITGRTIEISCGEKTLIIDWSQPTDSINLFSWRFSPSFPIQGEKKFF